VCHCFRAHRLPARTRKTKLLLHSTARPIGPAPRGAAGDEIVDEMVSRSPRSFAAVPASPRSKIRSLAEVAAEAARQRLLGQTIVQAHGTFDLIHIGHIRHLELARALGQVLIVTLTADRFVNKGPGRPVFNEAIRAEMLAALEFVDLVAIIETPDAVSAIEAIRPGFYVKGQDYANAESDVTGKIVAEREVVERHGGQIHFTDDLVFSSTELINRHFAVFEPGVRDYLATLRAGGGLVGILDLIERVRNFRVVLVGDAIIDEHCYTTPLGQPAKESIIAARFQSREACVGGVFAVANRLAEFCRQVELVTCLGVADRYEDLIRRNLRPNVELHAIRRDGGATTVRQRFLDRDDLHSLLELYHLDEKPLPSAAQIEVDAAVRARAPQADLVVAADFGHGLIARSTIAVLSASARFLAVNARCSSANMGYNLITRYSRADYACVDAAEARLAVAERLANVADVARRLLEERIDCPRLIVTQGKDGCVTCERGGPVHAIPAVTPRVIATSGAEDAFFAVTAPLAAAGGALDRVGFVGNVAAALELGNVGNRRSVDKASLVKSLTGLLR
jgi:rfaE bifunctional protein nucleotidyltransferase chain/domain